MHRRDFIKASCSICIAASSGWIVSNLSSCSPIPVYKTSVIENKIIVPLSRFASGDFQIIRPRNLEYDIALRKESSGEYTALLMRCTHADNQLISTGSGFICDLHGSRFNDEGMVIKGPAELPLKKFPTEIIADNIIVNLN